MPGVRKEYLRAPSVVPPAIEHFIRMCLEMDQEEALLADILSAGVYGGSDMSRKHSSKITLEAVSAQNRGDNASHGLLKSVFPSARELESRYPYLKSKPLLLPLAWTDRLINYQKELARSRANSPAESIRIGNTRLELLRKYGILDKK